MPALTVAEALSHIKQLSEIGAIVIGVWRGFVFLHELTNSAKEAAKTFNAIPSFMEGTTRSLGMIHENVNTAVTNHLTHMESGIEKLAESTDRLAKTIETHVIDMSKTQAVILDRLPQI